MLWHHEHPPCLRHCDLYSAQNLKTCKPMTMMITLILCCFLAISVQADTDQLRIGAFNIQVFGKTKFGKTEVVETLTKVC